MKFELTEMTVNSSKHLELLKYCLDKLCRYNNFDNRQMVKIYVDKNKDFTYLESIKYDITFINSAHKLIDTIQSPYIPLEIDISDFRNYVHQML